MKSRLSPWPYSHVRGIRIRDHSFVMEMRELKLEKQIGTSLQRLTLIGMTTVGGEVGEKKVLEEDEVEGRISLLSSPRLQSVWQKGKGV